MSETRKRNERKKREEGEEGKVVEEEKEEAATKCFFAQVGREEKGQGEWEKGRKGSRHKLKFKKVSSGGSK